MTNRDTPWATWTSVLLLAAWFGLVAGIAESAMLLFKRYVLQRVVLHGDHVIWLSPTTNLILFTLLGVGIALLARWFPKWFTSRTVTFILALLLFLTLREISLRVHVLAWILLSAGLAQVTSRTIARRSDRFMSIVRRTFLPLCGLVAATALACWVVPLYTERSAVNQLPVARAGAPNVLLLVMDTVPSKRLSLYGYASPTSPQLLRFADQGVRFDWCISTSPWTLPGHCAMFTGRLPQEISASWETPLDATHPTLAEVLAEHGYVTAGFPANQDYLCAEFGVARGFIHYSPPSEWLRRIIDSSFLLKSLTQKTIGSIILGKYLGQKSAETVNQEFLDWLSSRPVDRPFFGFLNYMDAHEPYLPPEPFASRFGQFKPPTPWLDGLSHNKYSAEEIQAYTWAYEGCLAYLDDRIGNLLDELSQRKLLDNTIVIIAGDHGEQLGEHGLVKHCNSLYSQLIRVPLVISFPPRVPPGLHVEQPVTLRDLPATILDLAGITAGQAFPGSSLTRFLQTDQAATGPDAVSFAEVSPMRGVGDETPLAKGLMRSLVVGKYHYIKNGDGQEELYDIQADPEETHNLAGLKDSESVIQQMRQRLADLPAPRPPNLREINASHQDHH